MFDTRVIRAHALWALFALPMIAGCVAEWHDDDGRRRPWWQHDMPTDQECPAGTTWDPVACVCVPNQGPDAPDAGVEPDPTSDAGTDPNPDPDAGTNPDPTQCPNEMSSLYLSRDFAVCSSIPFTCPDGYDSFAIESCGCGCTEQSPLDPCPEEGEGVLFISREADVCNKVNYTCPEGQTSFHAECGCGCIAPPPAPVCPDPTEPHVFYLSDDPAVCDIISFTCPDHCVPFDNECGCGCVDEG